MPSRNRTMYPHICPCCGEERFTTVPTGQYDLCRLCARQVNPKRNVRKHTFLPGSLYSQETLERFWSKVDKNTPCSCHSYNQRCWLWNAYIWSTTGYGCFYLHEHGRKSISIGAHRFIYQSKYGELKYYEHVLHRPPCEHKHCVRHLYKGNPQKNMSDTKLMGHNLVGERHPNTTLTQDIVLSIRSDYARGISISDIAIYYTITQNHVWILVNRKTWRHI